MPWKLQQLRDLAAAEENAFLDVRMDRLYLAMCRYDGLLLEPPVPERTARQQLNAALDAVTLDDIRRHMMAPVPPDSIYEEMLALKQARLVEVPMRTQAAPNVAGGRAEPVDDAEPEQGT